MPQSTARLTEALAGRYVIEREIGAGGMALVYLAPDVKHGRSVAIKVLKPELAAIIGADRFLREIEIAARLSHPHILPLFDSGAAGDLLYYVMPFVPGGVNMQIRFWDTLIERYITPARAALGDVAAAAKAGREMTFEIAVAEALEVSRHRSAAAQAAAR